MYRGNDFESVISMDNPLLQGGGGVAKEEGGHVDANLQRGLQNFRNHNLKDEMGHKHKKHDHARLGHHNTAAVDVSQPDLLEEPVVVKPVIVAAPAPAPKPFKMVEAPPAPAPAAAPHVQYDGSVSLEELLAELGLGNEEGAELIHFLAVFQRTVLPPGSKAHNGCTVLLELLGGEGSEGMKQAEAESLDSNAMGGACRALQQLEQEAGAEMANASLLRAAVAAVERVTAEMVARVGTLRRRQRRRQRLAGSSEEGGAEAWEGEAQALGMEEELMPLQAQPTLIALLAAVLARDPGENLQHAAAGALEAMSAVSALEQHTRSAAPTNGNSSSTGAGSGANDEANAATRQMQEEEVYRVNPAGSLVKQASGMGSASGGVGKSKWGLLKKAYHDHRYSTSHTILHTPFSNHDHAPFSYHDYRGGGDYDATSAEGGGAKAVSAVQAAEKTAAAVLNAAFGFGSSGAGGDSAVIPSWLRVMGRTSSLSAGTVHRATHCAPLYAHTSPLYTLCTTIRSHLPPLQTPSSLSPPSYAAAGRRQGWRPVRNVCCCWSGCGAVMHSHAL
jgi:hypothetical protein